ncbi:MAG: hypothetical protein APR56_09230 [Methanosaeta sp. SDB]|nr:MAG: hypothetical protein APR56_09230 [Methanosaeta sp. SDB]
MIEMTELANILGSASSQSLILLDEIGRGTSTFDGLSIAWSITEYIHNRVRGKAVFATHYHQLTQLAGVLAGVKNYNMAVKEEGDSVVFLRTVVPGATDRSYGIHVAKLAGVPEEVVARAKEILKEIEREAVIEPLGNKSARSRKKGPKYTQLIFFDEPRARTEEGDDKEGCDEDSFMVGGPSTLDENGDFLSEIRDIDLNALTPIDALNRLSEYQKRLRDLE